MSNDNLASQPSATWTAAASSEWVEAIDKLADESGLDLKTKALCYLSAVAAARITHDVPLRAARARLLGATRDEMIGAVLVGLRAIVRAHTERPLSEFAALGAP